MRDANCQVRLSLGYYSNSTEVGVTVEDEASGYRIVELQLSAEDFRRLLSSQMITADAWVIQRPHRDRLGARRMAEWAEPPRGLRHGSGPEPPEGLAEWAERQRQEGGYDEAELRNSNQGWKVLLLRYVFLSDF